MGLVDRLPDAPSESDSKYNGFLSYSGEFHALAVGLLAGIVFVITQDPAVVATLSAVVYGGGKLGSAHLRDARHELAYTAGGVVLGLLAGGAVVALL